jgi:peptidoglycan/LPS O-acetylase OafA/YrhL
MDYKDDEAERLDRDQLLEAAGGNRPNWPARILLILGFAISILGAFIPTQTCTDGCSIGPNFGLIGAGLLVVAMALFVFAASAAVKSPLVVGGISLIWVAVHLFALAANGWALIILLGSEMAAAPFVLVGGLIAAVIAMVVKSTKTK